MSTELPVGASAYSFDDPRPGRPRAVTVHAYRPASFTPESPVLIVLHGRNRNGRNYRDRWIAEANRHGFLVAVPEFSEADYAHPHEYNHGDMKRADGSLKPRGEWLFPVVDAVFEDLRARAGSRRERYFLFGHSAGGQVVHRLATFAWSPRIERAVSANAGSYTLPVRDEAFPFGLGGMELTDEELRAFFSRPLLILLGEEDNDPNHYQLPREPAAMRQGPHRFARGHHYMEVARREAQRLGVPLAWRVATAPGVAHSVGDIAPYAARHLFEAWPEREWAEAGFAARSRWSQEKLDAARRYSQSVGTAALMVVENGQVVAQWGQVEKRYKCHSIRKSLLSALLGLQVEAGRLDLGKTLGELGIDDREGLSPREKAAKVLDLVMARSGVYHPTGYETEYMRNLKPARHAHGPGTWWCYNNWDFNALGTIFERAAGRGIFDEFRDRIAVPLGMQDFRYDDERKDGEYVRFETSVHPAYPLRMSARDLARFGLLYLRGGRWKDEQVVPEKWVRMSVRSYSPAGERGGYGYMWWVAVNDVHFPQMSVPHGTYTARGAGGHYVVVIPALDLVVVHRADTDAPEGKVEGLEFGALLEKILAARRR
ncbi:MAG TPA: serine hydrolase [Usitatibacter sp.]|jgi:CubicO group peptidase (beta-lactamase class C family)/poly(3-hydroxybutyrate) depolymerase|nr:serine hydrolase [Usitatibacter sp.]